MSVLQLFLFVSGLSPLLASILLVIFASILINKLSEKANIHSDASIELVLALSIAIGVVVISIGRGSSIDRYSYLLGSILAISQFEVILSVVVSVSATFLIVIFLTIFF